MPPRLLPILAPGLTALAAALALAAWLTAVPRPQLPIRVPGLDKPLGATAAATTNVTLKGTLVPGDGKPAEIPGEWPCFRGPHGDAIYQSADFSLDPPWNGSGPVKRWSIPVGEGFAAPAVKDGRVYIIDYDREKEEDVVRCLSLADGKDIWQFRYPNAVKRNHGMSRTIPTVTGKYVVTIGPKCHVACLDRLTGEPRWLIDMVQEFGTTVPPWYAGQCPLVDGDRLILAPGGPDALLAALDLAEGTVLWKTPNPRDWKMTHSSVVPVDFEGRRLYLYCASGGVVAADARDGSIVWDTAEWKISLATVPSPLPLPEGRIFFCGGYDSGALMMQMKSEDGKPVPQTLFRLSPAQFGSTQQTPIFYQGFIYGVREKDKQMVCLDLDGKERWSSGSQYRFGLGPYMIINGVLLALDDDGLLSAIAADPNGFRLIAQSQVLEGHDCWGPPAFVPGYFLVRSMTEMACLALPPATE
ncbi:outer membrane protein assembly factor BamB family protein [Thermopirellula anaerolimosa]